MAKIARKTALVFATNQVAAPANQIADFGTKAAGSPTFNGDPANIQTAEWLNGWTAAVLAVAGGVQQPCLEDRNAVDYVLSYQVAYLMQSGIAEWDPGTVYFNNTSFCSYNGILYQSILDNNEGNVPSTSPTAWVTLASTLTGSSQGVVKAWVYYSGVTGAIAASFNVTGVTQLGTGLFQINFPGGLLPDGNYMVIQNTSNDNAAPFDPFTRFNGDVKTAVALVVRNLNGNTLAAWGGNQENYVAILR
jgi:hypothetical protein